MPPITQTSTLDGEIVSATMQDLKETVLPMPFNACSTAAVAREQDRAAKRAAARRRKLHILIADDSPSDSELMVYALKRAGFESEFDIVQTREQFKEKIENKKYEIILADYRLPGWNGMETIGMLREENLDVPVVLVSGSLGELNAVECIKQGAADYVLKDHLARLPESVRRAIEEKELRDENRRTHEELTRSNRDLEQFAHVASHDLQEPLRMVATYTQLLAERYQGKLDENADKYIHYAVDGALRMQTLVSDLLAFSRVGQQVKDREKTDCNLVLRSVLANLEASIQQSGARIDSETLPVILADRSELMQLLQNLIGNAIKFRSAMPPEIRISAEAKKDHWIFSITDNGIGIAPQHAEDVFVIFKRLHTREEYPGSGIGLSICKKIVERNGGCIWVEPATGTGSTFKFMWPRK